MSNFILSKTAGLIAIPEYYDERIFTQLWWMMNHSDFEWCKGW